MGKNKTLLLMVAGLLFFLLPLANAVTWENEQARLTCTPDTSWSPSNDYFQYCELENKQNIERTVDLAFLFEQNLDYGRLYLGSLKEVEQTITDVISYPITELDCEIGIDGTRRFVTIQNSSGTFENVYCYQSITQINNETFAFVYHDGQREYNNDITNDFNYLYRENLNNPYAYYYEDAVFNPLQTRYFKIEYSLIGGGKWDFWVGDIQTQNTYYLLDPWAKNSFFNDSFNRSNSATVGNGWTENEAGTSYFSIDSNKLKMYRGDSTATILQDDTIGSVPDFFNWSFTFEVSATNVYTEPELADGAGGAGDRCVDLRMTGGDFIYIKLDDTAVDTGENYLANTEYKIIVEVNLTADRFDWYVDGVKIVDDAEFRDTCTDIDDIKFAIASNTGTVLIDEMTLYNQTFVSGGSSPFVLTASNIFDSTAINVFNATIDGVLKTTTNGSLNTGLFQNSTQLHNITVISANYFDEVNINLNVSSNYEATLYQSEIFFACYEKVTSSLLTCNEAGIFYYNAGTYETQANVTGYNPIIQNITITALDNKTINFTDFTDSTFLINASYNKNSSYIPDFTLNFTDDDNNWSEVITASGFNINNSLISGRNYTIYFNKAGFVDANASFSNFSSRNYTFDIYEANSINISIFKESDLSPITESVTIRFSDENATITNYVTTTGNRYINNLDPSNYTISFISTNYTTRTVNTVFNNDYQVLNVYLIASGSSNTIFTFQDRDDGSRIAGVTLSVQKLINTTWTLVESLTSDITGRTSFDYSTDVAYRFIATATNYQDKNWTLDPILFESYIIKLDKDFDLEDNSDFNGITVYFVPKTFKEDTNTSINFTFSNPNANFIDYGFNATWDGVNYVSDSGSTGIGSNINATLEIVGSEMNDYVTIIFYYELANGERYEFTRTYIIQDSNTAGNVRDSLSNGYGLGLLERLLIVVMIALLVAGAGAYFGGALAGGALAMLVLGLFSYTGFISWWLTLPSLIVMFIVATWRSSS